MSIDTSPETQPDQAGDGVPNPVFHHINLLTNRMDEMIDWYGLATGMRPNFRSDSISFLSNDHANHRIALLCAPGLSDDPDKTRHTGMHHSAFEFGSLSDLLTRYRTLRDHGIVPHSCLDHGFTLSYYYEDPDGNNVEMQVDQLGDWSVSANWMRTATEFVENPIGNWVDPEQVLAAFEAGTSPDEIHRRGYAGEFFPEHHANLRLPEV